VGQFEAHANAVALIEAKEAAEAPKVRGPYKKAIISI
jgi:hypothetical protein